jgi:hypothetical protein
MRKSLEMDASVAAGDIYQYGALSNHRTDGGAASVIAELEKCDEKGGDNSMSHSNAQIRVVRNWIMWAIR